MLLSKGETTPPCGVPRSLGSRRPSAIASGLQHCLNEAQHSAIGYSLGYEREKFRLIHRPEEILQICVHNPLPPTRHLFPNFAQGILCRPPSPISEVGFVEHRLEDRFQPIEQRLLAHPVVNRRDSQRAKLSRLSFLRDPYLPYRLRPIDILL